MADAAALVALETITNLEALTPAQGPPPTNDYSELTLLWHGTEVPAALVARRPAGLLLAIPVGVVPESEIQPFVTGAPGALIGSYGLLG